MKYYLICVRSSCNYVKKDPYKKEKEKIKELDRVLAAKEREYRERKNAEKIKRLQDLEDLGEEEISVEKYFLL